MKKSAVVSFLNMLGFTVAEDALVEKNTTEPPVTPPVVPPVAAKPVVNADPPATTPPATPPAAAPAAPDNLALLNQLITDIGGFESFKAVLLAAVEMGKGAGAAATANAEADKAKRAKLIPALVANSKGALVEADLDGVATPVIEKMIAAQAQVSYAPFGVVTANEDKRAPRPVFLLPAKPTQ